MKAALLLLAVAGAALIAASHASARQATCKPSTVPRERNYCGPAQATLKVGGKTYHFKGGMCAVDGQTWTLNIGAISYNGKPTKRAYFGITMFSNKAGRHGAAITWILRKHPSQSLLDGKVKLARGLQKGTFTGKTDRGGKATGSFRCS